MKATFTSGVRTRLPALAQAGLVLAVVAVVGVGASGPRAGPPPELEALLPHAVVLWKSTVYETLVDPVIVLGVGDVDGDGILDIVCGRTTTILVFAGQGDGRFTERLAGFYETKEEPAPSGAIIRPVGRFLARHGALADLDGDGALDLAAVVLALNEEMMPRLYLFPNTWGAFFDKAFPQDLPFQPDALWAADLTGDGVPDLLLVGEGKEVTDVCILPGEGKAKFGPLRPVAKTQGRPFSLADVDNDGAADLGLYTEDEVILLFGDGKGGFPRETRFRPLEGLIYAAALGDLDGDGDLDLAIATSKGLAVGIFQEAEFVEDAFYPLGGGITQVLLADFSGDGVLDALVDRYGAEGWALLPGDGKGGFLGIASEHLFPPVALRVADLNGDNRPDLLCEGGYSLWAFFNGALPRGESEIPFGGTQLLAVGDLSGNGAPDLVVASRKGVEVLWNNGQGAFVRGDLLRAKLDLLGAAVAPGRVYLLHRTRRIADPLTWAVKHVGEVWVVSARGEVLAKKAIGDDPAPGFAAGDLDGDGPLDLLALRKREVAVLFGEAHLRSYPWEQGELSLAWVGDLDRDGVAEAVVVSTAEYAEIYVLSFAGRRLEVAGPRVQLASVPLALSGADFDGDGTVDVVVISLVFEEVGGALGMGVELGLLCSKLGPKTYRLDLPLGEVPWPLTGLAVGDFTGDRLGDVAISVVSGTKLYLFPGNGDGTFGEAVRRPARVGPIFAADLDGNGQHELIASTAGLAPHLWILWNGGEK